MKNLKTLLLLFTINIFAHASANAQESKQDKTRKLVESQTYIFKAWVAYPLGGNSRQLTSDYDVIIKKNSVTAYLPYFGQTYTPPIAPAENGIKFTSTNFEYKLAEKNRKGWEITIVPKDIQGVQQLNLSVSNDGDATLEVVNTSRQNISFSGYIK
jgi:hypothetical protein